MFVTEIEVEVTVELILAKARDPRLCYLSRDPRTRADGARDAGRGNRKRAVRQSSVQDVHSHWTNARLRNSKGRGQPGGRAVVILQTGWNRRERQTVGER